MRENKFDTFCNENICNLIKNCAEKMECEPNQIIFRQGDKNLFFIFICNGAVKLERADREGNIRILGICSKYEFSGLSGFFTEGNYTASVSALKKTTVYLIDYQTFFEKLVKSQDFICALLANMDIYMNSYISETILLSSYRSVDSKLAYILLELSRKVGIKCKEGILIDCKITDEFLGNIIGINRETVTREMSKFKMKSMISKNNKYITIHNERALEDLIIE